MSSANRIALACTTLACLFVLIAVNSDADEQSSANPPRWTTSRLHGSPLPPEKYGLVPAFPKLRFDRPTSIEELPGAGRLLVSEMGGKLLSFAERPDASTANVVLDLREILPPDLRGRGVSLFDAEPHPRFSENHYLFVCYVHPAEGGQTRVSRFTLDGQSPPHALADSEQVVITWPAGGHNGGCLEFGKDGFLFVSTGDGSGPNPPDRLTTGQDVSDLLGAILRIDVDHASGDRAYRVPDDNPFVGRAGARPEIWSYGLRNPWKFGTDVQTGDIFAADNGWETWELVHRIVRGGNGGWPRMEGRMPLRSEVEPGPTPILPPVKDHPHSEANSVIGGPVYRGKKLPDLDGSFIYGDYITGTIWALRRDCDEYSHATLVDTEQRIVAFTQSSGGGLYVLDYDFTGQIYELLPSTVPDTSASFPRRLSETGLFASVTDLKPATGVVPYRVKAARWLDGANAQRWVAVPGKRPIELAASIDGAAAYPEGTVFAKHLSFDQGGGKPLPLETQILHFENGVWHPYSYLWNEAGDDAELVEPTGANRQVRAFDRPGGAAFERTWHVNAVNECKLCHNSAAGFVLGFMPYQLDLAVGPGAGSSRQLSSLAAHGVLAQVAPPASDDRSHLVDPHDESQDLDARARSYLHANCAACHRPGGNAIVSFYLRRDLPFERLNTYKGSGIGTFGLNDPKIIVPGNPQRSLLLYRMSKLGYARMPYIGSRVVDSFGVALIDAWIRSLGTAEFDRRTKEALSLVAKGSAPREARESAIRELLGSTSGALMLAMQVHRGDAANDSVAFAASTAAGASGDVRGLFDAFIPESQRRPTLGANADVALVLKQQGDRERGKLIYFSDAARCRACHDPVDRAKSLGPTLNEIGKKYPRDADLISHVVRPSEKIDEAFWPYLVATADGRVLTGLIVEKDERRLVLKTADKQTVAIAREEIEELRRGEKSLMPDGLLSDLTAQEAADLLAYLRSCHNP